MKNGLFCGNFLKLPECLDYIAHRLAQIVVFFSSYFIESIHYHGGCPLQCSIASLSHPSLTQGRTMTFVEEPRADVPSPPPQSSAYGQRNRTFCMQVLSSTGMVFYAVTNNPIVFLDLDRQSLAAYTIHDLTTHMYPNGS